MRRQRPRACADGVRENDIALAAALKTGSPLTDCEAVCTRTEDMYVGLPGRARIAGHAEAGLFVSVHCSSAPYQKTYRRDARLSYVSERGVLPTFFPGYLL